MSANKTLFVKISVKYLFLVLTGSIFITETLIMFFLDFIPPMSNLNEAIFDATLLSILTFPFVYFFTLCHFFCQFGTFSIISIFYVSCNRLILKKN